MGIRIFAILILFNTCSITTLFASDDIIVGNDTTVNKKVLRNIGIGAGVLYAGSMFGLYNLWYKNYPQSSFHFINDNHDWLQIDKVGHATSSYHLGLVGFESLRLAGMEHNKAAIIGGSLGLIYLSTVEVFDGFSAEWGASSGDIIANLSGTVMFMSQQLLWKEQRIQLKWSVHSTEFAQYRPDIMGRNLTERLLKDYNGHTYWLSANISSFLKEDTKFPKWINLAGGYGGTGMLGVRYNPLEFQGTTLPQYDRTRRYFISPDIDISKIKVNNKTVTYILKLFTFIKIPMPTIEFNSKGIQFHPLYF